jgi:hypothetical protein
MPRILSIDIQKRTGIAVTDEMSFLRSTTIPSANCFPEEYFQRKVEAVIIKPIQMNGQPSAVHYVL